MIHVTRTHLNPAEYVIHVCKGSRAAARLIGYSPSSVSKWLKPRTRTQALGLIPVTAQQLILQRAQAQGLDITAQDLVSGRDVE